MTDQKTTKKYIALGAVAIALLIIPRRSSRRRADNNLPARDSMKARDNIKNNRHQCHI